MVTVYKMNNDKAFSFSIANWNDHKGH